MPISYRILREKGLVLTTGEGVLTDGDIMSHKERLSADPDFDPAMDELTDVRSVREFGVTPAGVQLFVEFDKRRGGVAAGRRLAIVVDREVVTGMARMYRSAGGNDAKVGVFDSIEEARRWLGLEAD